MNLVAVVSAEFLSLLLLNEFDLIFFDWTIIENWCWKSGCQKGLTNNKVIIPGRVFIRQFTTSKIEEGLGGLVALTLPMAHADRGSRPVYFLPCRDLGQVVNLSLSVAQTSACPVASGYFDSCKTCINVYSTVHVQKVMLGRTQDTHCKSGCGLTP